MEEDRDRKKLKRSRIWYRDDAGAYTGMPSDWARKKARGRHDGAEQGEQDAEGHGAANERFLPLVSDGHGEKPLPPLLTGMDSWGGMAAWGGVLGDEEHEAMASLL
nr:uncharacterized protein LOC113811952 [Penaeus vannamei]